MGWRKDFKDALITELKKIADVGTVGSTWKQDPTEYPALTVSLTSESYDRTMGASIGVEELGFEVMGRVQNIEQIENVVEELLDNVIEKIEGITSYDSDGALVIEETMFHEKSETGEMGFTLSGKLTIRKDYSSM